jgi:hypothetical protein
MISSLLKKLKSNSKINSTAILSESELFLNTELVQTEVPMINVALSGSIHGGISSGLTVMAGPSKHFKTNFALLAASTYLKKYKDAALLYYDSEFGSPIKYFQAFDIDINRVLHTPVVNIEKLKFDLISQLEGLARGEKVFILVDSIGNLASKKELEDTINEKSVIDMTRARALKGLFRMINPYLTLKDLPMFVSNHTYQSLEFFSKPVVSGGCVLKGTEIVLANGSAEKIEKLKVGDMVETVLGPRPITHTWNPDTLLDGKPPCLAVEFEDKHLVVCSTDHKFKIEDQWIESKNLKEGMRANVIHSLKTLAVKKIIPVGNQPVYDLSVEEAEHYVLKNGIITHNTGIYYSANNIWIIGRQQDKDKTSEVKGYHFIINVEKSRYVKEKSKISISVSYAGGIMKYSGLLDVALEGEYVIKPKAGWYVFQNPQTKEEYSSKLRERETISGKYWKILFEKTDFDKYIEKKYSLGNIQMLATGDNDLEFDYDEETEESETA